MAVVDTTKYQNIDENQTQIAAESNRNHINTHRNSNQNSRNLNQNQPQNSTQNNLNQTSQQSKSTMATTITHPNENNNNYNNTTQSDTSSLQSTNLSNLSKSVEMNNTNQNNPTNQNNTTNSNSQQIEMNTNSNEVLILEIPPPDKTGKTPSQSPLSSSENSSMTQTPNNTVINGIKINQQPKQKHKKPLPTQADYDSVLQHYQHAKTRDIEGILRKHYSHLIDFRDKTYENAFDKGISEKSPTFDRLKYVGKVVEYVFFNIEPPDEYTKKTDRRHFKEVAALGVKFFKNQYPNREIPVSLVIGCWLHDIERYIPETKCKYLAESVDKYRKRLIHALTSARVAMVLLKNSPISQSEKDRIYQLIIHHDKPINANIEIQGKEILSKPPESIVWELQVLMDADSYAFFQSTIYLFILFKAKKNSKEWIWERVRTNVKRLRPHLRTAASHNILKLPNDVRNKIAIDENELSILSKTTDNNPQPPQKHTINTDEDTTGMLRKIVETHNKLHSNNNKQQQNLKPSTNNHNNTNNSSNLNNNIEEKVGEYNNNNDDNVIQNGEHSYSRKNSNISDRACSGSDSEVSMSNTSVSTMSNSNSYFANNNNPNNNSNNNNNNSDKILQENINFGDLEYQTVNLKNGVGTVKFRAGKRKSDIIVIDGNAIVQNTQTNNNHHNCENHKHKHNIPKNGKQIIVNKSINNNNNNNNNNNTLLQSSQSDNANQSQLEENSTFEPPSINNIPQELQLEQSTTIQTPYRHGQSNANFPATVSDVDLSDTGVPSNDVNDLYFVP